MKRNCANWNKFIISHNLCPKTIVLFEKYQEYLYYKSNPKIIADETKMLEFKIMSVLEKLNFPINESGTYLYGEIILKLTSIINKSKEIESIYKNNDLNFNVKNYLLSELSDLTSDFYLQLAGKDMSLTSYHSSINKAMPNKIQSISKKGKKNTINYGKLAYEIANYMTKEPKKSFSIKQKKIIPPSSNGKIKLYK